MGKYNVKNAFLMAQPKIAAALTNGTLLKILFKGVLQLILLIVHYSFKKLENTEKHKKEMKIILIPPPCGNQWQHFGVLYFFSLILVDIFPQLLRFYIFSVF